MHRTSTGTTLIESLTALAVVGVLSALLVPTVLTSAARARLVEVRRTLAQVLREGEA